MLDLKALDEIVKTRAALRVVAELEPVGGRQSRIFPPTYIGKKYAEIKDGERTVGIILDSPQSQASRMEALLEDEVEDGTVALPRIVVDLGDDLRQLGRNGKVSSLAAPHRWADAILRDSLHNKDAFEKTEEYKKMANSKLTDVSAIFAYCPSSLLFGVWDSHNRQLSAEQAFKCARLLVSEITAFGIARGMSGGVRQDPLGIGKDTKGFVNKEGKAAKPSDVGHGSVPFLGNSEDKGATDEMAGGGIIADRIELSSVVSLSGLRRLGFGGGEKDNAARAALAALGIFAIAKQAAAGYMLRSRCDLFAPTPLQMEVIPVSEGGQKWPLDANAARNLLNAAIENARRVGLDWMDREMELEANDTLKKAARENLKKTQEKAEKNDGGQN